MRLVFGFWLLVVASLLGCEREGMDAAEEEEEPAVLGQEMAPQPDTLGGGRDQLDSVRAAQELRARSPLPERMAHRASLRWDPSGNAYLGDVTREPAPGGGAAPALVGKPLVTGIGGVPDPVARYELSMNQAHPQAWGQELLALDRQIIWMREAMAVAAPQEQKALERRLDQLLQRREMLRQDPSLLG